MNFKNCKIVPYSKSTRDFHLDHRIRLNNIANTITCGRGGANRSTSNFVKYIDENGTEKLRLMSVKETEGIMTWPKDWTKYGINPKGEKYLIPANARYKACGNGIVSRVAKIILEKLIPSDYKAEMFHTFSGVHGSTLSLDEERFHKVATAEFDPKTKIQHAANILRYHYPDLVNKGDMTKIKNEDVGFFNLMFTSPPCQTFSSSGKREGLRDTRGTLFHEVVRILDGHKECEYLFFENVSGLVTHDKGETFLTMLAYFSKVGFELDFEMCNAQHFGVPQARERIYLFGRRTLNDATSRVKVNCEISNPKSIESLPVIKRLKNKIRTKYPEINLGNFNIPLSSNDPMISWSTILDKKNDESLIVEDHCVKKVIQEGIYHKDRITLKTPKK